MLNFEIEAVHFGIPKGTYAGQFSPAIDKIIKKTISGRTLHLFSGSSLIGDERIDLAHSNATKRMNVFEFIEQNKEEWDFCVLDPPYKSMEGARKLVKSTAWAGHKPVSGNTLYRRIMAAFFLKHCKNVLWFDYVTPCPKGFERKKVWFIYNDGYRNVRALSWLVNLKYQHAYFKLGVFHAEAPLQSGPAILDSSFI